MGDVVKSISTNLVAAVLAPATWFAFAAVDYIFGIKKPSQPSFTRDLKDRTFSITDSEAPHVYIYGRARVGSAVVAVLTSGSRDQYKHIVCVHAAHECDAIEEIYINGKALGTLDANGDVTTGEYSRSSTQTASTGNINIAPTITLDHTPSNGSLRLFAYVGGGIFDYVEITSYTLTGTTISSIAQPNDSLFYMANYSYSVFDSYVRVKKHLGEVGQIADSTTISEVHNKWNASCTLTGMCYTIIRIDLNFSDFQQGCPKIEALIRGKKLHDVRDVLYPNDIPVWSQNNALMIADYLTSDICSVPWTDLPLEEFITAANVCDEVISVPINIGARYTANGTITSADDQRDILEKMAASMAGTIVANTWVITAGKYIAPIVTLDQSDIVGDISYTPGQSESDLFNGVKGQYISSSNLYVATDFEPYKIEHYAISDGQELWTDLDFMFTDTKQRVHNLCRIYTEDQRNAFTIKAYFSYKTFSLKVGDRISFTSTLLGQVNKIYRVIGKSYSGERPVSITLKEDSEAIWDFADEVIEDQTPNTDLPSPFIVQVPANILITEELYQTTGSAGIKTKAIVTWDTPSDINVLSYEITYKGYSEATYNIKLFSISEYVEIMDIAEGIYDLKIRARNHLNLWSEYTNVKTFTIYGLSVLPANVSNFTIIPFNGSALARWDRTTELDVKIGGDVEIRFCPLTVGASWEQSYILPDGNYNGDATNAIVSLATGTYYAKFKDSTGNYSSTPASFIATESLVTGWSTVQTSTQHTTYTGVKTNVVAVDNILKLTGAGLFDSIPMIDSAGYIDAFGGLNTTGTYEFDAVMDLTTSTTRRFHAHIKSLSYNSDNYIDSRLDLIDTWQDIDGGVINGANVSTFISVSDDNITYTNWTPFMVADFNCRYAKFKTSLTTNDSTHNIDISELSVSAKIPV